MNVLKKLRAELVGAVDDRDFAGCLEHCDLHFIQFRDIGLAQLGPEVGAGHAAPLEIVAQGIPTGFSAVC